MGVIDTYTHIYLYPCVDLYKLTLICKFIQMAIENNSLAYHLTDFTDTWATFQMLSHQYPKSHCGDKIDGLVRWVSARKT